MKIDGFMEIRNGEIWIIPFDDENSSGYLVKTYSQQVLHRLLYSKEILELHPEYKVQVFMMGSQRISIDEEADQPSVIVASYVKYKIIKDRPNISLESFSLFFTEKIPVELTIEFTDRKYYYDDIALVPEKLNKLKIYSLKVNNGKLQVVLSR